MWSVLHKGMRNDGLVVGSFIIGLDIDEPGIGKNSAAVASQYGADNLNVLFLTPLPGTRLWDRIKFRNGERKKSKMENPEHLAKLKEGVEAWNK